MRAMRMGTGVVAALVVAATGVGCGGDDGASCPGEEIGKVPLQVEVSQGEVDSDWAIEVRDVAVGPGGELYFNLAYSLYCIADDTVHEVLTQDADSYPEGEEDSSYIAVGVDPDGTPLLVDWQNPGVYAVEDGEIELVPGTDAEEIGGSRSIVVADDGTIYMTGLNASGTSDVFTVTDGKVERFAGGADYGVDGSGGPATEASLDEPEGLAFDDDGNLLIADRNNQRVVRVTPDGILETVAGGTGGPLDDFEGEETLVGPNDVAVAPDGTIVLVEGPQIVELDGDDITPLSAETADCVLSFVPAEEREEADRFRVINPFCPIDALDLSDTQRIEFGPDGELWMTSTEQLLRMVDDQVEVVVEFVSP